MNKKTINYAKHKIFNSEIKAVTKILKSNFLTQGPTVFEFETKIKEYCKSKYAVAVNSATSALHIACLSFDLKSTDIVWTSANSFVASSNCALYCGAKIDFVDIDLDHFNISTKCLEDKLIIAKIKKKLPKILIVVHHGGNPLNMKKIYNLSKKYKFKIVEDASHALGSTYETHKIGSGKYSEITIFSFHPIKTITSCEGGMVLTNNKEKYEKLKVLREHGINKNPNKFINKNLFKWQYEQVSLGYNYRMSDLHAAVGKAQLGNIKKILDKRKKIASIYSKIFYDLKIAFQKIEKKSTCSYHLYTIILSSKIQRDKILIHLRKNNINASVIYNPIYLNPYYKKIGFKKGYCKNSEEFADRSISLPIFYDLNNNDIILIVKLIKEKLDL